MLTNPKTHPNRDITDFTRVLAVNRFDFAGSVFMSETGDPTKAWLFLFATQQPLRCFFLPVSPARREIPLLPEGASFLDLQRLMAPIGNWEWTWSPGAFVTDAGLPIADLSKVWVHLLRLGDRGLGKFFGQLLHCLWLQSHGADNPC